VIRVLSVSMPRSGHHVLEMVLTRLLRDRFHYCEFYTIPDCCRSIPCVRTDVVERSDSLMFMQKTHDHDLTDPKVAGLDGLVIQVREPVARMLSNYELHLRSERIPHSISYQRLWMGLEAFYTVGFVNKWCGPIPNGLLLKYEDLTGDPVGYFSRLFEHFRLPSEMLDGGAVLGAMRYSSDDQTMFRPRQVERSLYSDAELIGEFCRLVDEAAQRLGYDLRQRVGGAAGNAQMGQIYKYKLLVSSNRLDEALRLLDLYLAGSDPDVMAKRWRPNLLACLGRTDEAVREYEILLDTLPPYSATSVKYAELLARTGHTIRAKKVIADCLAAAEDKSRAAELILAKFAECELSKPALEFAPPRSLSRQDVVDAFRLLLGREPESEQTVKAHQKERSMDDLRRILILSEEFADKYASIG